MPQDPVARGKRLYALNCTICHNADPSQPGVVGPEIAGASPELLAARVLRAQYPPGYQPKRSTTVMPAMPQLQPQPGRPSPIEDLAAYLQQAAPSAPHKR